MPTKPPPTKPGTRKLSDLAKHLVSPTGIASTGWPAVRNTCTRKLGVVFDEWQDGAGRLILAKRADGKLAATIDGVGMSLPRQVGKTYLIGALVFALCINNPGLLVIWSAHHARTHGETFLAMQAFAERAKVKAHVRQVYTGSGDEEVRFHNGSRILFGARERGFGRGIPGVDVLIFDEAQILSDKALANMLATMNTSQFGLQLYIGTPPKPEDMSEAFTRMRNAAVKNLLPDGAWIEFGADRDADHSDRKQWRKANPSYPGRTPEESMLRLQRKLTPADWLREGMGIWDEEALQASVISTDQWGDLAVRRAPRDGIKSFGVKFSPDGSRVAVIGASKRPNGIVHLEIVGAHTGSMAAGTAALVEWFAERWRDTAAIVIDGKAHAGAFVNALIAAKVSKKVILTPTWPEVATGNAMLLEGVRSATITNLDTPGQQMLTDSVGAAGSKLHGESGAWSFEPIRPDDDAVPVQAAALALYGAKTSKRKPGKKQTGQVM
jgi:hypothetical protein